MLNSLPDKADYKIKSIQKKITKTSSNGCRLKYYNIQYYSLTDSNVKEIKKSQNFNQEYTGSFNKCTGAAIQAQFNGRLLGVNKRNEMCKLFEEAIIHFNTNE